MFQQSFALRVRPVISPSLLPSFLCTFSCSWCTSMLGRKSSLKSLLAYLRSSAISARVIDTTEFRQGTQSRYGIAWTFNEDERKRREETIKQTRHEQAPVVTSIAASSSSSSSAPTIVRNQSAATHANDDNIVPRQKVRFSQRFGPNQSITTLTSDIRSSITSYFACACELIESSPYQWKIVGSDGSRNIFACDLLFMPSGSSEYFIELQWRKPVSSSVSVDASKKSFTRFALQLQADCSARR